MKALTAVEVQGYVCVCLCVWRGCLKRSEERTFKIESKGAIKCQRSKESQEST